MEGQVPASQQPDLNPGRPPMTPEDLEALKEEARRRAIMQAMQERKAQQAPPPGTELSMDGSQFVPQKYPVNTPPQQVPPVPQPQIVYLRRNLTVAEVGLMLVISVGILAGIQFSWNFSTDILSRIEIREK
jgi:hypothetical protein